MLTEFQMDCHFADQHKRHEEDSTHRREEPVTGKLFSIRVPGKSSLIVLPSNAIEYEEFLRSAQTADPDAEFLKVAYLSVRDGSTLRSHYRSHVFPSANRFVIQGVISVVYLLESRVLGISLDLINSYQTVNKSTADNPDSIQPVVSISPEDNYYLYWTLTGSRGALYPGIPKISNPQGYAGIHLIEDYPVSSTLLLATLQVGKTYNPFYSIVMFENAVTSYPSSLIFSPGYVETTVSNSFTADQMFSLRNSAIKAAAAGSTVCFPISLKSVYRQLAALDSGRTTSSRANLYLKQHAEWLRPLVYIHTGAALYTNIRMSYPQYDPTGVYNLMTAMMSIDNYANASTVFGYVYDVYTKLNNFYFYNQSVCDSDIAVGSMKTFFLFFSPTPPYINVINTGNDILCIYINSDQCAEPFDPWILQTDPVDTPILYKGNGPFPEEYIIIDGLVITKVFFSDITSQGGGRIRANKVEVVLDVIEGTIFTVSSNEYKDKLDHPPRTDDSTWHTCRDLTGWTLNMSELTKYRDVNYRATLATRNATMVRGTLKGAVQRVGDAVFVFGLSTTPTFQAVNEDLMNAIKQSVVEDKEISTSYFLETPVYFILGTVSDLSLLPDSFFDGYERIQKNQSGQYVEDTGGNPYRGAIYSILEGRSDLEVTYWIYKYSIQTQILLDWALESKIDEMKEREAKVEGTIFTRGLDIEISGKLNERKETFNFHVESLNDIHFTTTSPQLITTYSYIGRLAYPRLYLDKELNTLTFHTDIEGIIFDLDSNSFYSCKLQGLQEHNYTIQVISDMEAFHLWIIQLMKKLNIFSKEVKQS